MSMTEIKKNNRESARIGDHHFTQRVDKLADKKIGSGDILIDRRPRVAEIKG